MCFFSLEQVFDELNSLRKTCLFTFQPLCRTSSNSFVSAYLKMTEPLYLANGRDTWMFIGITIAIVLVVLLVIAMLTLSFSKRNKTGMGDLNRQQAASRSVGVGKDSMLVLGPGQPKYQSGRRRSSPTYINFRTQPSNLTLKSGAVPSRPESSTSSSSFR